MSTPAALRSEFPITGDWTFVNHAGISPLPSRAVTAASRAARTWPGDSGRDRAWIEAMPERLRELFGRLVGADPDRITLAPTTAFGLSLFAGSLDWRPGDTVIGLAGDHPANVYPWLNLGSRGVRYRALAPVDGGLDPELLAASIDSRTRVVALTWVQHWNGRRADLAAIGEVCRERGVLFAVDGIQGVGALDLDLSSLPVDFLAAATYKWMMGPNGCGLCYWHPDLDDRLRPPLAGGAPGVPPARMTEPGRQPAVTLGAAEASLEGLLAVGIEAIEPRVAELAARLAGQLAEAGCELALSWPRAVVETSGIVAARVPGMAAETTLELLRARRIVARTHRGYVRLATHCWNTEEEVDQVAAAVAEVARGA